MSEPRSHSRDIRPERERQLVARLRGAGLRPTRQRLHLAALLLDGPDRHLTAEDLHHEAAATGLRLSLATVYNNLHQFTEAGLLRAFVIDQGRLYFDTNIGPHHHFYCEASGRLTDVAESAVTLAALPPAPAGKSIERVDVIIRLRDEDPVGDPGGDADEKDV